MQPNICLWLRHHAFVAAPRIHNGFFIRQKKRMCTASTAKSVVILGGSSGVGLETARYLKAKGVEPRTFSRRTGHDFANLSDAAVAVEYANEGVAVCIGAGRRQTSFAEELTLYKTIASALRSAFDVGLVVAVVRSLALSEVTGILSTALSTPWVILRPGAMDGGSKEDEEIHTTRFDEELLVTPDMRCNGLVSRRGVARVVGDLLLGSIPLQEVNEKIFGVYDQNRMICKPRGCTFIGADLWCDANC